MVVHVRKYGSRRGAGETSAAECSGRAPCDDEAVAGVDGPDAKLVPNTRGDTRPGLNIPRPQRPAAAKAWLPHGM